MDAHRQPACPARCGTVDLYFQTPAHSRVDVGAPLHLDQSTDLHAQIAANLTLSRLKIRHQNRIRDSLHFEGARGRSAGGLADLYHTARIRDVVSAIECELAGTENTPGAVTEQLHRGL